MKDGFYWYQYTGSKEWTIVEVRAFGEKKETWVFFLGTDEDMRLHECVGQWGPRIERTE
jgi:hypothetical protein